MDVLPCTAGCEAGWGAERKNGVCAPCQEARRMDTAGRGEGFDFMDPDGLLRGQELNLVF